MKPSLIVPVVLALCACPPAGPQTCKLTDATTCTGGLVCERVKDKGNPYCVQPFVLNGTVKALGSGAPIANAEIVAVDVAGKPVGPAVKSDSDGTWKLPIPTERSEEQGTPIARTVLLRAAAQDFLSFPAGVRTALPVDTSSALAASEDKPWIFSSPQTDLTLSAIAEGEKGFKGVAGEVERSEEEPAPLVVLEGPSKSFVTVPDSTGAFHLLNVPPGSYKAQAYLKGLNYTAVDVTVAAGAETTGVSLKKNAAATATGTMSGSVQLAPGASDGGTSVVLVVESTLIEVLGRGEPVRGLRAPESGGPTLNGAYSISGIPDGKYVAVVGFEDDGNVRDPDPVLPMSQLARVTVAAGVASANPVFRVVGAVVAVSPGASESIEEVAGVPTFTWMPYPDAASYELVVFSTTGAKVWENQAVPNVPNSAGKIVAPYNGIALKPGVVYQWRVTARSAAQKPLAMTEDSKGLFQVK